MNPKYPVYIISKGRWESRLTSKSLEKMGVPYHIVIEPQEYDQYAEVIDEKKILTLPFSNLGRGGIPARNWVWKHSKSIGAERHWILDDNIDGFGRLNHNHKIMVDNGVVFKVIEDFVERYENVAITGMHYDYFIPRKAKLPPYYLNTRVYSNLLIKNDLDFRWRGKYNEDTDLCIRVLKAGWCTILFNAFICYKTPTLIMKGGNTDSVYIDGDNRYKFAESLYNQHPDIVTIVERYGRYHHEVEYSKFKRNKLIRKPGLEIPEGINNYGMVLKKIDRKSRFIK